MEEDKKHGRWEQSHPQAFFAPQVSSTKTSTQHPNKMEATIISIKYPQFDTAG